MSSTVKVIFMKSTLWREKNKHYNVGDIENIPPYLLERWRRARIVQEYNGEKKQMTPDEAYDKLNIKALQLEAEKMGIAFAGKNKKQLLKDISRKAFYFPKAESKGEVDEIVNELPEDFKIEEETFEEKFEETEKGELNGDFSKNRGN